MQRPTLPDRALEQRLRSEEPDGRLPCPLRQLDRTVLRATRGPRDTVHDDPSFESRLPDAPPDNVRCTTIPASTPIGSPPTTTSTSSTVASAERHEIPPVRRPIEGELLVLLDARRGRRRRGSPSRACAASSDRGHARSRTSGQASPDRASPTGPRSPRDRSGNSSRSADATLPPRAAAWVTEGASSSPSSCATDADQSASPSTRSTG